MNNKLLPTAAVERVVRAAGADRVSATASEELAKVLAESRPIHSECISFPCDTIIGLAFRCLDLGYH